MNVLIKNLFFLLTFSIFTTTLSAQETDTIAEKPEPDAINTGSASVFDSAAVARYENVDHIVLAMKKLSKKTPILAKEITAPFTSEEEKVRALFVWVTNNISYDCAAYHAKPPHAGNLSYKTQAELEAKLDKYYSNIATLTVRNKKAVCEGYSVLFWQLCKVNGIHCQLVDGRASENKDKIKRLRSKKKFNTNHMWNKVQVNGVWYYIDVTWASGYCDPPVTKFFKKFNPFYFLTPLDKLFPTHAENIKLTEKRNHPISE